MSELADSIVRAQTAVVIDLNARIADLERQLAEAQTWRDDARKERDAYMKSYDAACDERDEAQGKLEAVREWYASLGDWGDAMLPGLAAILGEKGA